jgi:hypothetical protein
LKGKDMETDLNTLGVTDMVKILKIKPQSLHARLVRRPESLPRPVQRGAGKKLLWLRSDREVADG